MLNNDFNPAHNSSFSIALEPLSNPLFASQKKVHQSLEGLDHVPGSVNLTATAFFNEIANSDTVETIRPVTTPGIDPALDNKRKLEETILKTKNAYLKEIEFKKSQETDQSKFLTPVGKGANGSKFVYSENDEGILSKISIFKPSPRMQALNATLSGYLKTFSQSLGYRLGMSQRAVVAGAGSQHREACSEKAGYMIAEKLHQNLISFVDERQKTEASDQKDYHLTKESFTPMIAGITSLENEHGEKVDEGSIAIFNENVMEAANVNKIVKILDKDLNEAEKTKFQFFILYDYLSGNPDRHTGNWMIKLKTKSEAGDVSVSDIDQLNDLIAKNGLKANDLIIDQFVPIDNGNIMPDRELGMKIIDSKQYQWKDLSFARHEFTPEIKDFIQKLSSDSNWVDTLCNEINSDSDIARLSSDIGKTFIKEANRDQMKLRFGKLKAIVEGKVKTPKELAEAPLRSWSLFGNKA